MNSLLNDYKTPSNSLNSNSNLLTKLWVWQKGLIIPTANPSLWRLDIYGRVINFSHYGDRNSPFGWEFDHIIPKSFGGSDQLHNIQPLHWKSNLLKNNSIPLNALHQGCSI